MATKRLTHNIPSDKLPSLATQAEIANYTVLDREGKEIPFRSLYSGPNATDRTLIILVRHFFCGSCQEYLLRLSQTITPTHLSTIPITTSIVIIGCGGPALIDHYAATAQTPYPIYADPTLKLYNALEMVKTMKVGPRPEYISKSTPRLAYEAFVQMVPFIRSGKVLQQGPGYQQGGEVLFEPVLGTQQGEGGLEREVTWCNRMQRSWGRTEIRELEGVVFGRVVENPAPRESTVSASEKQAGGWGWGFGVKSTVFLIGSLVAAFVVNRNRS
ncbi:hypothetical protein BJY04DRAFT_79578 [Aspergillus karnatakaensis]|uniref:uncharacterized protein n=1 Tax=Aspergillus karnatakaensis TaxID=1810916 RepID=UPI003CCE5307